MKNPMGLGVAIGIALGTSVGASLHNLPVGVGCGAAIGVALGTAMKKRDERNAREQAPSNEN